jgi:hypothetical protein
MPYRYAGDEVTMSTMVERPSRASRRKKNMEYCVLSLASVGGVALDSAATCPRRRLSWPPRAGCPCGLAFHRTQWRRACKGSFTTLNLSVQATCPPSSRWNLRRCSNRGPRPVHAQWKKRLHPISLEVDDVGEHQVGVGVDVAGWRRWSR